MPVGMLVDVIAKVIRDREWSHLHYIYKVGSLQYNGTWRLHVVTECAYFVTPTHDRAGSKGGE